MLYEIRNYHFDPALFDEYKVWSREIAAPYFRSKMDIVGAWFKNDMPCIHGGSKIKDVNEEPANFTWVIRWKDREERDRTWEDAGQSDEWRQVFSKTPGGNKSFLRTEVKFAEEM